MRATRHLLVLSLAVTAAAAALAVAVVAAAPARPARSEAVSFLRSLVRATAANRYGETWASLSPGQQRLVPRDVYARCERRSPIPGRLASLRVLAARPVTVRVPLEGRVPGWAVRMRLVIAARGLPSAVVVHTFHVIRVDGSWRWYLPAARLALYDAGCGRPPLPKL